MCQSFYDQNEIRLVGEESGSRLFHCSCKSCGHAMLAVILETSGMVSSIGVVTDLEVGDALRFRGAPSVSMDECIRIHRLLEEQSFAFCQQMMVDRRS
jgi:hypothetical protein